MATPQQYTSHLAKAKNKVESKNPKIPIQKYKIQNKIWTNYKVTKRAPFGANILAFSLVGSLTDDQSKANVFFDFSFERPFDTFHIWPP